MVQNPQIFPFGQLCGSQVRQAKAIQAAGEISLVVHADSAVAEVVSAVLAGEASVGAVPVVAGR